MTGVKNPPIPTVFIWRRVHSLAGLWLVIYLIQHLLVNSQAALLLGDYGKGFITSVNSIHELPYLPVIEIAVLGIPILIHTIFGISYALSGKMNSFGYNGKEPYLPEYGRNRAYTWQRVTSWLLIVGIIAHVVHMRFIEYPASAQKGHQSYFMVTVDEDPGIYTLSKRLDVDLYTKDAIEALKNKLPEIPSNVTTPEDKVQKQNSEQELQFVKVLESRKLKKNQMVAVAKDFGTAELMMVRETFKMPIMMALYTFFVLAACFHGFNGLWTFMIKWGVTLTQRSQKLMLNLSTFLMFVVAFLGLSAIFGTYWFNLRQ